MLNNKKTIENIFKNSTRWIKRHIALSVNTIAVLILIWLGQLVYATVYQSVIAPQPIDQSEIIARRKRVNTDEFTTALELIQQKQAEPDPGIFSTSLNPFD